MTGSPIMLAVDPYGNMTRVDLPAGDAERLQALYAALDCQTVDLVRLRDDLDMWADDEGVMVAEPVANPYATYVAMRCGLPWQTYVGTVAFTGGADAEGATLPLSSEAEQQLWRWVAEVDDVGVGHG